jgi:hypothetical protein
LIQRLDFYKNSAQPTEPEHANNNEPVVLNNENEHQQSAENTSKLSTESQATHKHKKKKNKKIKILEPTMHMMSPRKERIPILKIKLSEIYNIKRQKQAKRKRKELLKNAALKNNNNIMLSKNENKNDAHINENNMQLIDENNDQLISDEKDQPINKKNNQQMLPIIEQTKQNLSNCSVRLKRLNVTTLQKYSTPHEANENPKILKPIHLSKKRKSIEELPSGFKIIVKKPADMNKTAEMNKPAEACQKPEPTSGLKSILSSPNTRSTRSKSRSVDPEPAAAVAADSSLLKTILCSPAKVVAPLPKSVPSSTQAVASSPQVIPPPPQLKRVLSLPPPLIKMRVTARKSLKTLPCLAPPKISLPQFKMPENSQQIKPEKSPQHVVRITNSNHQSTSTSPMISIPTELVFPKSKERQENRSSRGILLSSEFTTKKIRPWLEKSRHRKMLNSCDEMLSNGNCMAAVFKCMGSTCSYFTNDQEIFKQHLQLHVKHNEGDRDNFQKCCYCENQADSVDELINHIFNVHGTSK